MEKEKRILVVGGGGSRGAWGVGFIQQLVEKNQVTYPFAIGTSTGSLMAPFIVLQRYDLLKAAYTSVSQKDIFDVNPFTTDGNLRALLIIWRMIIGKKTFGESNALRSLIKKWFTATDYDQIKKMGSEFMVTCVNYKNGEVCYECSGNVSSYERMVDWIWASANEPLFMSFVGKGFLEGGSYVDGGVRQNVPVMHALQWAREKNISVVDVIINKPRNPIVNTDFIPQSILKNLKRLIELWETQIRDDNIRIATLLNELSNSPEDKDEDEDEENSNQKIQLNFHYIPREAYEQNLNELIFDPAKMLSLWKIGFQGKEDMDHQISVKISHRRLDRLARRTPSIDPK